MYSCSQPSAGTLRRLAWEMDVTSFLSRGACLGLQPLLQRLAGPVRHLPAGLGCASLYGRLLPLDLFPPARSGRCCSHGADVIAGTGTCSATHSRSSEASCCHTHLTPSLSLAFPCLSLQPRQSRPAGCRPASWPQPLSAGGAQQLQQQQQQPQQHGGQLACHLQSGAYPLGL